MQIVQRLTDGAHRALVFSQFTTELALLKNALAAEGIEYLYLDRIGQTQPVTIYRLIARNTIEEKILKLYATKKDLSDSLLEGSDLSGRLTREDLLELLKE